MRLLVYNVCRSYLHVTTQTYRPAISRNHRQLLGNIGIISRKLCSKASEDHGPLQGIRVLDLSRALAGPFCAMLLGDLGAEVIKVERPDGGDDSRSWGPPFVGDQSCYFLSINRNKKSIGVNLKAKEGVKVIHNLAKTTDIIIENNIPGKTDKLKVDYQTLKEINPSLIYCSITGFGPDGPYSKRGGYDIIGAALSGLLNATGHQDSGPSRVGVAMTDLSTGLYAHGAIMAALLHRKNTGKGQKIDCSLLSSQVSLMSHIATDYLCAGQEARRWGTGHENIVPYQAFKTKDDMYFAVVASNEHLFKDLCQILDANHLLEDSRYENNQHRVENREALVAELSQIFNKENLSEWMRRFEGSSMPYAPIKNMQQVFSDPQVLHNNMIQEIQHSTAGTIRVPGPAVKYSTIDTTYNLPPPRLSEHTEEVLQGILGYSQDKIQQLHQDGAVGCLSEDAEQV